MISATSLASSGSKMIGVGAVQSAWSDDNPTKVTRAVPGTGSLPWEYPFDLGVQGVAPD